MQAKENPIRLKRQPIHGSNRRILRKKTAKDVKQTRK